MRTVHLPIYGLSLIEEELWDTEEYWENTDREDVAKDCSLVPETVAGEAEVMFYWETEHTVDAA